MHTKGRIHIQTLHMSVPSTVYAIPISDTYDVHLPIAYPIAKRDSSNVMCTGFIALCAMEGIVNTVRLAAEVTLLSPEFVLTILCPWFGCFGALNGNMVLLGVYVIYAIHMFMWRLCELIWLTHAPLSHTLVDDTRVMTVGDEWTLQVLVLIVLARGWMIVYVKWVVNTWWTIMEHEALPL